MIHEIYAKVMLSHVKQPDPWFGLKYNMNLYRGCQHQCIYCDSRSLCYQIEKFSDILVKINAVDLLRDELPRKRVKGTIGTGSMNDPYMPVEKKYCLMKQSLELFAIHRFPVHIITKSDLVLRDIDLLKEISEIYAAVTFTITTADDVLAKKLEPGAPLPSARLAAMRQLAAQGILTGVSLMPVLPYLEDNEKNIRDIVKCAVDAGASYFLPSFGMTLRDRQRAYYYDKLDLHFPGLSEKYEKSFGDDYFAPANNYERIKQVFDEEIYKHNILDRVPQYQSDQGKQLSLF